MKDRNLSKQLRQAGANENEIGPLTDIAQRLQGLRPEPKAPPKIQRSWRLAIASIAALLCLAFGAGLTAFAQTSLPGSLLYPAKRLSENMAVKFDPSYRATLMMRRSEEVQRLVEQKASSHTVLATLSAYQTVAANYKSPSYPAFEYCKNNFKQAAAMAPKPEQQAINNALLSLQNVD